jgi:hypothetical protein
MTRTERRMAELIDWGEVRYLTDEIQMCIGKIYSHRLDYTGDIRLSLELLTL